MSQIDQTGSSRKVALSPSTSWYRLFFAVMLVMAMVATVNQVAVTEAQAQVVTSEQIGSGTLDSSKATAPRFERVFFDALATGPNTIRVLWDSNADVIFTVNDATTGERLARQSDVVDPGNFTIDLVEGTAYFLGVSSRAGIANYTAYVEADTGPPAPGGSTLIGQGTVDQTTAVAPRWVRIDFNGLVTGPHTVRVEWDSNADLTFTLNDITSGDRLVRSSDVTDPGSHTIDLVEGAPYFLGLWSRGGVANYTVYLDTVVDTALAIDTQPADTSVAPGADATFTVDATGDASLAYQWSRDGVAIAGATSAAYTLVGATLADDGAVFTAQISDGSGAAPIVSAPAVLTVEPLAVLFLGEGLLDSTRQVAPRWVRIDFNAIHTGDNTVRVLWDSNADVVFTVNDVTTGERLLDTGEIVEPGVATVTLSEDAPYFLGLWSRSGIADYTVQLEALTSEPGPAITTAPTDQAVSEGNDATFSVVATGEGTVTYQWLRDGESISGATNATYTLANAAAADSGAVFTVRVSDASSTIISDEAVLTVVPGHGAGPFAGDLTDQCRPDGDPTVDNVYDRIGATGIYPEDRIPLETNVWFFPTKDDGGPDPASAGDAEITANFGHGHLLTCVPHEALGDASVITNKLMDLDFEIQSHLQGAKKLDDDRDLEPANDVEVRIDEIQIRGVNGTGGGDFLMASGPQFFDNPDVCPPGESCVFQRSITVDLSTSITPN